MQINTSRWGAIQCNDEDILHFNKGIIGFEEQQKFILIPAQDGGLFGWLQSTEDPRLAFVVANPFDFYQNYEFDLHDSDAEELGIQSATDAYVLSILVIPSNPSEITANLLAPIVINIKNRQAQQCLLKNVNYHTRHYVLQDLQNAAKTAKISQKVTAQVTA